MDDSKRVQDDSRRTLQITHKHTHMITGNIEFHDDHAILAVLCDELTEELNKRLEADGWSLATNGHKEDGKWYTLFVKHF